MCGIAGIFSEKQIDENVIAKMLKAIAHRGPDGISEFHSKPFHGGMCRLSINDIENGNQPLYNSSNEVAVIYNGEIYNSPDLRSDLQKKGYFFRTMSDGEVIAHLYDEVGENVFGFLDGMFAIALWDTKRQLLFLARDQIGEKPLFYGVFNSGRSLVFASEIKAIKQFTDFSLTINRQALWDFPTFLWIPEPNTIFKEVSALEGGNYLKIDTSSITKLPYKSRLKQTELASMSDAVAVDETRRVVLEAVKSRLLSDVPVGSFLSGGLDSSIVATIASRELGPIDTFSVGFEDLADPYHGRSDESADAADYAKLIGSRHHTIRVSSSSFRDTLSHFCSNIDQPFAVSSALGISSVSKCAKEVGVKVLLSGDCADECFGGYSWYKHLNLVQKSAGEKFDTYPISYQNFGIPEKSRLEQMKSYSAQQRAWAWHYYAHEQEKRDIFSNEFTDGALSSLRHFFDFDGSSQWLPERYIENDRMFYMKNEMLQKLDRFTMAHSIEGRVPFAAPSVLSLARRLKFSQMVKGQTLKWALRRAFSDVLPTEIIQRPKHGFNVPVDHWLKGEWNDLLMEAFSSQSALRQNRIISSNAGEKAEQMLFDKSRLNGHTLFCFVVLNRWLGELY